MATPLFDKSFDVLEKAMDLQLVRQAVISDNIANAETPYFKARRVEFENALQQAMEEDVFQEGGARVKNLSPEVIQDPYSDLGQDMNTVDMDKEMAEMTKNDLKYSAAAQAIQKKFSLLKYVITENEK